MDKVFKLTQKQDQEFANKKLAQYYKDDLIPAEKKPFLTDLKNSFGPYLGIKTETGETHGLMDASSQIATFGLGFNPQPFFGVAHHLESWLNRADTENFKHLKKSFTNFLKRKTNWDDLYLTLTNSGAEANEVALGYCYQKRVNHHANKVLAFEGSFHGRLQVTLSATWNPSKREPFEWKDFLAIYSPFPAMNNDQIIRPKVKNWSELWGEASSENFKIPSKFEFIGKNKDENLLALEISCLLNIRDHLSKGDIFAILAEPMQCEGGDRFGSDRFFTALLLMAKSFRVPVIIDEVQTGFNLGRDFFWHKSFNLELEPDYVTCAKKAQVGIVLSHDPYAYNVDFSVASAIRGYINAISIDQSQEKILELEKITRKKLQAFCKKFSQYVENPRVFGLAFALDIFQKDHLDKLIKVRFDHSLLYYPAGDKTLRFRLNLGFRETDLDYLFLNLENVFREVYEEKVKDNKPIFVKTTDPKEDYDWHEILLETKLKNLQGKKAPGKEGFTKIKRFFEKKHQVTLHILNKNSYKKWRKKISALEMELYEPARQTPIEAFDKVINDSKGIGVLAEVKGQIAAITFCSPMKNYPLERGLRLDPYFNDKNTLYIIDTSVRKKFHGKKMGRDIKYVLYKLAELKGFERIHGRNRDRMAASMLKINLSLGAFENYYLAEDYPDFEPYRDVICYTSSINWKMPALNLSNGINAPLGIMDLNFKYIKEQLPGLINKVCLSNMVSESFLNDVMDIFSLFPKDLRHGYTTSGQSEATDKLVKTIWYKYKNDANYPKNIKLLTFKGHYFGEGSFLSRTLSGVGSPYFPVKHLDAPSEINMKSILSQVEEQLVQKIYHSVWIEPLTQMTLDFTPKAFLVELKYLCEKHKVPLVYNETASSHYRYEIKNYFASNDESIRPDAGMCFLGGQAGICYMRRDFYLDKPLMLISTWDGDEFSFKNYTHLIKSITPAALEKTRGEFQKILIETLIPISGKSFTLKNGFGNISGNLPLSLQKLMDFRKGKYIICPSHSAMLEFIKNYDRS
jgi:4-aminobutyrate aminotransferase-like enzyme